MEHLLAVNLEKTQTMVCYNMYKELLLNKWIMSVSRFLHD